MFTNHPAGPLSGQQAAAPGRAAEAGAPAGNQAGQPAHEVKQEVKVENIPPGFQFWGPYPPPRLAQAYVIWQKYGPLFSPPEALEKGTVFPELCSPYPY